MVERSHQKTALNMCVNYSAIYHALMDRAQNREIDGYTERHHIIPRCMGGSDDPSNIAILTPEEHFLAHLLLVKMYPRHTGLVFAVTLMCRNPHNRRWTGEAISNRRMYGWVRRRFIESMKQTSTGASNSQFGSMWICNVGDRKNRKIKAGDPIPDGWVCGRNKWNSLHRDVCTRCGRLMIDGDQYARKTVAKYCGPCRRSVWSTTSRHMWATREYPIASGAVKGSSYFNNGIAEIRTKSNAAVPDGFIKGRLPSRAAHMRAGRGKLAHQ